MFDSLILCTGFAVAWDRRPELAGLAPHVVRWRDRFQPAGGDDYEQADDPFLGSDMEFLERQPGVAPWVQRVHCFTFPAFMSHGPLTGDIPAISVGAERVATGLTGALFAEDYERNWARLLAWDTPELNGDEVCARSGRYQIRRRSGAQWSLTHEPYADPRCPRCPRCHG